MELLTRRSERARHDHAGAWDPTGEGQDDGGRRRRRRRRAALGPAPRAVIGWCAVAALLLVAVGHLAWRGPVSLRGHWNLCDFASPWASARLWLTGQNPYDNARLWDTWVASRGAFETDHEFWTALNAPGAYAALAPLAALPAGAAGVAWLAISAASIVAILAAALSLARIPPRSLAAALIVALALASAPVQTVLTVGQLSLPVIALCFVAMRLARDGIDGNDRRDGLAGVALGIALAVKPQLAAPLVLYFLLLSRWRVLLPAAIVACALTLVAVVPMQWRGIPWWADWSRNVALSTAPGGPNDPTSTGPWRGQMIDLRAWLFTLTERRAIVVALAAVVSLLLVSAYAATVLRARRSGWPHHRDADVLPLAAVMALGLLPVYHKSYDAVVLVLALAWAVRALRDPRRRVVAVITLASLSAFLIPFDLLPLVMRRTRALDGLSQTWLWRAVIYPHHALAALATALCVLYAWCRSAPVARTAREPRVEDEVDAESDQPLPARG